MNAAEPAAGPVGVVLAGGAGRRIGGAKASTMLAGRPLIAYPLAALRAVLAPVAVVVKRDSDLPPVGYGVEIWREPDEPQHPLVGIIEALRRAAGRSVVVLACDLPLVTPDVIRALLAAPPAAAVLARAGDDVQPLCARFGPGTLMSFAAAGSRDRLQDVVWSLAPAFVEVDPDVLLNVNDPAGLALAEARLG